MKENFYQPPKPSQTEDQLGTFTDHPAYQEPIERSVMHNRMRAVLGWIVMISSTVFLVIISITIILNTVNYLSLIDDPAIAEVDAPVAILHYLIRFGILYLSYSGLRWGRHLTRPTSREFA